MTSRLDALSDAVTSRMADELSASDFVPRFFELKIGGGGFPATVFDLPDGGRASLIGKADRVDVMEKDGKAYVRVVDYKTGRKFPSGSAYTDPKTMQLPLYLLSLTASPRVSENFFGMPAVPSSFYYLFCLPEKPESATSDAGEAERLVAGKIKRLGRYIDGGRILGRDGRGTARYLLGSRRKPHGRGCIDAEGYDGRAARLSRQLQELPLRRRMQTERFPGRRGERGRDRSYDRFRSRNGSGQRLTTVSGDDRWNSQIHRKKH